MVIGYIDGVTITDASFARSGHHREGGRRRVAGFTPGPVSSTTSTCSRSRRATCDRWWSVASVSPGTTSTSATEVDADPGCAGRRHGSGGRLPQRPARRQLHRRRRRHSPHRLRVLRQQRSLLRARQHLERVPSERGSTRGARSTPTTAGRGQPAGPGPLAGPHVQYGWTLWASIPDATSRIDFDYWSWGMEKYERAVATFRRPRLRCGCLTDAAGRRRLTLSRRSVPEPGSRSWSSAAGSIGASVAYHLARLGRTRHRPDRAGATLRRNHLARGRLGRPAPGDRERHPAGPVLGPALLRAGAGDRAGNGLQAVRRGDGRPHSRPNDPAAADGRDGGGLRSGVRATRLRPRPATGSRCSAPTTWWAPYGSPVTARSTRWM